MKTYYVALTGALLFLVPVSAQAQSSPAAMTVGGPQGAVLRTGTKVPLKLSEQLTTKGKALRPGQRFNMEVAEAVLVSGQTVIPLGAPAVGEIADARNKGMWGKSGRLSAQILYVTVNGRQIKLTGTFDDKGHAGGGAAVATSALVFAPAGFFMTGTSAKVAIGTPVMGFVGEDVPLAFAGEANAQPLTVPVTPVTLVAPTPVTPTSATLTPGGVTPRAK